MKLFMCLVLAAVTATTICGQAPVERQNALLDGLKVLSDILTDKNNVYVRHGGHDHDHDR